MGSENFFKRIWDKLKISPSRKMLGDGNHPEIMKVEDVDQGIESLVTLLNGNYMRPFASCDGTIETHYNNGDRNIGSAYVAMMDSEKVRDLFAILQDNEHFNLVISNNKEDYFIYGNHISGLRFSVHFENLEGNRCGELENIVQEFLSKKIRPTKKARKRIDMICDEMEIAKKDEIYMEYAFHDIYRLSNGGPIRDNYFVRITDDTNKKDLRGFELYDGNPDRLIYSGISDIEALTLSFEDSIHIMKRMMSFYSSVPLSDSIPALRRSTSDIETELFLTSELRRTKESFWAHRTDFEEECLKKYERIHKKIDDRPRTQSKVWTDEMIEQLENGNNKEEYYTSKSESGEIEKEEQDVTENKSNGVRGEKKQKNKFEDVEFD